MQDIVVAVSQLQRVIGQLADATPAIQPARRAKGLLERALGEIRHGIGSLRPDFEARPLREIVERVAMEHEQLTDQVVELTAAPDVGDCPLVTKLAISRILQHALANRYRHTGARRQRVWLRRSGAQISLTVSDRERGYDVERMLASDLGIHDDPFGLRGIHERVAALGGRFALTSTPGRGSSLTVTLPAE